MKLKTLFAIYTLVLTAECVALLTGNFYLELFAKPLLMPILILYFVSESRSFIREKNLIIAALVFSWLGDVLLLFDKHGQSLFIFGLLSFLVAHLFYIFYFWRVRLHNAAGKPLKITTSIAILVYSTILYLSIFPYLSGLKIPVLVYSLIISLMLLASIHAFDLRKQTFGRICVLGTILFVASDSLLAINRFVAPFALAPIFVMITYAAAQLLITEGSVRNLREIEEN